VKHSRLLFFAFNIILASCFFSQEENKRFFLSPVLGLQGAQIDGDYYSGYNKAGIFAGLLIGRELNQKSTFNFGLAYSQKGARENPDPENGYYDFYLSKMHYVELPLMLTHHLKRFDFNWGFYYGRLIKSGEENQNGIINTGLVFKANDFGYSLGLEYKIFDNVFAGVRHTYSVLPVRDYFFNGQVGYTFFMQRLFNRGLYNNTLMFYIRMRINPGKFNLNDRQSN
jgi:hypothetical protein